MADDLLTLRYVPLSQLAQWTRNKKRHDLGAIIASIERHGYRDPMAYDANLNGGTGGIVEGNGRDVALVEMQKAGKPRPRGIGVSDSGEWVVPVLFGVDAPSQAAAEAYAIDHNNITVLGGDFDLTDLARMWDDGFTDVLKDLGAAGELPVSVGGDELDRLLAQMDEPPADPGQQIDKATELQEKWQVKRGDLWQCGRHRILCGDSTSAADVARLMQGEKAQLVVTSPPYAVGKEYEEDKTIEQHFAMLRAVADNCIANIIPGGFIFTNFGEIAAQSHASPLTGSKRQCIYLISKDYWQIFHDERSCDLYAQRIWYKPFNRLQQPFWTYHTSVPHYQEWEHIWTWRTPGGDDDRVCDWDISVHAVWDTRNEATEDHPLTRHVAAFPVCLPGRAIKAHSMPGEIILEPFLGSGTTLIVCEQTGRIGRGIEIEPKYVAVSLERLSQMGLECKRIE